MLLTPEERSRYARHILLPEVGAEGQARLKAGSVVCVGTGGLGSPALMYLAAAGVGRIGIIDFDEVDRSNLQRQIVHNTSSIGRPKVLSAAERLKEINPNIQLDLHNTALTGANALALLEPYDVIIDGTDNFPTRYLTNDAAVLLGKPYVYGSIFRFEGQASVFNYQGGPDYRDLYPDPPPPGSVPSCAEAGVLGVLPGIIGTIQATEALKLLLGIGTSLSGRLLLYDALHMRFRELALHRDPTRTPVQQLTTYHQLCAPNQLPATRLSVRQIHERLRSGWAPFVLDVRTEAELAIAALSFTDQRQDFDQLDPARLPADRDILVFCRSGARSQVAIRALRAAGLTRLFHFDGGILAWSAEIDPSIAQY